MGFVNGPNIQTFRLNRSSIYRAKTHAKCIQIRMVLVNISSPEIESHQIKRQNKRIHFVSNCEGYEQSKKNDWLKKRTRVRLGFISMFRFYIYCTYIWFMMLVARTHTHTQRKENRLSYVSSIVFIPVESVFERYALQLIQTQ